MSNVYIGTWRDYYAFQEEEFFKQNKVTNYAELLSGMYTDETKKIISAYETGLKNAQDVYNYNTQEATSTFQHQTNSLMRQTRYDISNAYANYKKSQLNLMQQNMLGSGFKDYYGSQLKSAFDQAVSDYKFNESEQLNYLSKQYEKSLFGEEQSLLKTTKSLDKSYESALESLAKDQEKTKKEIEKQLEEDSKKYAQIEGIIREMIGINDSNADKYYETITDVEKGTKTIKLKDLGKDEFDRVINSIFTDTDAFVTKDPKDKTKEKKYYSLTDYLFDLDPDLYEFYVANKSNINKWVAGLEADDNSYSKEEREIERKQIESEILKSVSKKDATVKENVQKRLNEISKQKFNSYNDKINAYKVLKEDILELPEKAIRPTYTLKGSSATSIIHDGKNYLVSNRGVDRDQATPKMLYDWGIGDGTRWATSSKEYTSKVREYDVFIYGTDKYIAFKNSYGFSLYKMVEV